jgi:fatty-acid desaturase
MFAATFDNINFTIRMLCAAGLVGILYFLWSSQYSFIVLGIALGWVLVQFSHHVALHRYFSHKSFETSKFWHIILCFSTVFVGGTPVHYALPHLAHHAFTDTEKDPHSPVKGFWKVLLTQLWNVEHLDINLLRNYRDYWIKFVQKWYLLILLIFCVLLISINANLILSYGIAILFTKFTGVAVNYAGHLKSFPGNYRNFDTNDNSCNNLFTGIILGEWHNNHHHMPRAWNQRVKWWELDVPANIIRVIKND